MLNFDEIKDTIAGRLLTKEFSGSIYRVVEIRFGDFIKTHINGAETYQQVYDNLQEAADSIERGLKREGIRIDSLAGEALEALAIRDAMKLIEEHYLK